MMMMMMMMMIQMMVMTMMVMMMMIQLMVKMMTMKQLMVMMIQMVMMLLKMLTNKCIVVIIVILIKPFPCLYIPSHCVVLLAMRALVGPQSQRCEPASLIHTSWQPPLLIWHSLISREDQNIKRYKENWWINVLSKEVNALPCLHLLKITVFLYYISTIIPRVCSGTKGAMPPQP